MPITVGSVEVDIIPSTQGIYQRLRAALVPPATRAGEDAGNAAGRAFGPAMASSIDSTALNVVGQRIGQQIAARITAQIRSSLSSGISQGGAAARPAATRQGDETGGAFARAMKARLEAAYRSLPNITVGLNTTQADSDLQALRARMETLADKRIGVDISAEDARAEIDQISAELARLGAAHPDVTVRADTAKARQDLAGVRAEIDRISAARGTIHLETDGSFGARLRAAVQAAEAALPNINIGADTTAAQAELASLRAQLTAMRDQRVGIDIDAAAASAQIDAIRARLTRLGASSSDIAVRVDAATAEAQLAQVEALADAVDGKDVDLHVSNREALSAIFQVAVAIGALVAIPAIPVLAAGAGSLVAAFTAAGVGVGAFAAAAVPALTDIKGALDAQKQAQVAASTATAKGGQTAAQAAARALQMAGAQQALASAERNGARQIQQAQQAVADAVRQAAQANTQASAQVKQAQRGVADAVEQAAQRQQQADRAVASAEKDLAQAQITAKQAQLDLIAARKTAAEQLQDQNNQLKDAQLAQERAVLAVRGAQKQLDADRKAGSGVSADQLAADQLSYEEAQQALVEQRIQTKRLQDTTDAANKAGVKGSATYTQAQDAVAKAQQDVADKTQALSDARAADAKTEVDNARTIADAQSKLADAQKNVATVQAQGARAVADAQEKVVEAQQSAADSITSAQRQIQSASLSAAGSVDASATAAAKYQQALAKLTPSARGTFNAFVGLRSAFKDWSRELQPQTMPIFTRALDGMRRSLPGITPLVLGAARGIGTLQDRVSRGFKSPWWKELKKDFANSVEPAIAGVGRALGNVFVGSAGVVDAFLPHIDSISNRMDRITGRFANFGKNLKGSPEFENFLSYSAQEAPKLADALGKIGGALVDTAKAVSPLSGPVLALLGAVAQVVSSVATSTPGLIQLIYGLFLATRLVALSMILFNGVMLVYRAGVILSTLLTEGWTAAIIAADAAFAANPIVAIVIIIVAALTLLVVGILYAWNHWTGFRDVVLGTWHAIQTAALYAWNSVLKPTFTAIAAGAMWLWANGIKPAADGVVTAYRAVATAAVWLWRSILAPVFSAIGKVFSVWWSLAKIYFTAVWTIFRMVGAIALWLWHSAMDPVFRAVGRIFALWWAGVKLYFNAVMTIFRAVGSIAMWLWTHAFRPSFQAIGDLSKWLWTKAIRPVFQGIASLGEWLWSKALQPAFNAMKTAIGAVAKSFVTAKDLIASQWSKVGDLAKKPISFLVNTVYNKGILGIWNKVADIVSGPHLKPVKIKGFATGGVAEGVRPGYTPGRDTHLIAVGGGEAIMRPEFTRGAGAGWVDAMNAIARRGGVGAVQRALGVPGFFGGGIIDTITSGAKKVGGAIKSGVTTGIDWAKTGVELLANPGKIWDKLTKPLKNLINKAGSSKWAKLAEGIPLQGIKDLGKEILSLVGIGGGPGSGGGTGPIPTGQHAQIITQALAAAQVPPPGTMAQWMAGLNTLITRESGWNPKAINLTDSNAAAGYPSQGLAQTIPGTFNAFVPQSLRGRGITDPVANVAAAIRYIVSRYGNITNVQQANANKPPQGYDQGGYLQPGLNLAYNGTGRPEPVFTTAQANALTSLAASPGHAGKGGDVNVFYNAPTPENPQKAAMELGRRTLAAVTT